MHAIVSGKIHSQLQKGAVKTLVYMQRSVMTSCPLAEWNTANIVKSAQGTQGGEGSNPAFTAARQESPAAHHGHCLDK